MKKNIKKIGIIGGGQLGRMICFSAHKMGFETVIFTDQKDSPASFVTNKTIVADYLDKNALKKFASMVDIVTFEFENIPFETLNFVSKFVATNPSPDVLKITQNRILEKNFLNKIKIKTTKYKEIKSLEDIKENFTKFGRSILKTATMGYDGHGQFSLKKISDINQAWQKAQKQNLILEKFCNFDSEISVIIAANKDKEVAIYDPLTNIHKDGILDKSIYPAQISDSLKDQAKKIAKKIAKEINLIGIMAVEFFVKDDELFVNELAPRPHNSGHFSMDANFTSQFEQLIRAITNLPLGNTKFHSCGFMKNLIGKEILETDKFYKNLNNKIHIYGKKDVVDRRKMGHVNCLIIKNLHQNIPN